MEEKQIIKGTFKKNYLPWFFAGAALLMLLVSLIWAYERYENGEGYRSFGYGLGTVLPNKIIYSSFFEFYFEKFFDKYFGIPVLVSVLLIVLAVVSYLFYRCEITVTDKRVFGRVAFGKRVDLPMNQISALGRGALGRISVATSSGKINFYLLKNLEEVYQEISTLLNNLQSEKTETTIINQASLSNAEELKKYKALLDAGVITQEEFDAKKKQLLSL